MIPKTTKFHSLTDVMRHCGLNTVESDFFIDAMVNGDAAYGTNMHSLVSGQYICQTILDGMDEDESAPILDKMQRFLLDCDDADIAIDLEG